MAHSAAPAPQLLAAALADSGAGAEINRIQKTLEGANIKLGDVASDVLGVSSRRILEALIGGATDPTRRVNGYGYTVIELRQPDSGAGFHSKMDVTV